MAYTKRYADWKKKIWFEIIAPEMFNEEVLGETPAYEPEQVIGRRVETNLALLTGDFRLQNAKVIFRIVDVKGEKAYTQLEGYELYEVYIRRIVRRGTDRIDDSFVVTTRDGKKIRVKPIIITQGNTSRSVHTAIRKKTREIIENIAKENDALSFMRAIVYNQIQSLLKKELHKIYPIDKAEIRKAYILPEKAVEKEKQAEITAQAS